jgi:hypothetical protein
MLFNKSEKRTKLRTLNKEHAPAFKPSEKTELVLRAATTMGQSDKFYETAADSDMRFVELIQKIAGSDPEFALKLAWYTRKNFYLRTPATVLLAEIARTGCTANVPNASKYVAETISRVDDMTELIAYCMKANERDRIKKSKIPMVIKRGVAKAFNKFDAYQFAKYTKPGMYVTPKDVMFLTHPKSEGREQMRMHLDIIQGTLPVPETWETYISVNGSTKEAWSYILDKMGYMGIVRNLRNMIQKGVNENDIVDLLTDKNRVRRSKMFPYQFYSAYRAIEEMQGAGKIMGGLSVAMDISAENFPMLDGLTAIFCDNSGSMRDSIHPRSSIRHNDIANVFGAMLSARSHASLTCAFGSDVVLANVNPRDSILTNAQKIAKAGARAGGATYTGRCIQYLKDANVDRIVFFTDQQGYGEPSCYDALKDYRKNVEADPYVFTFDLAHYGTTQFPEREPRHATVGGWSDTILKFIPLFESDRKTLLEDVENVSLT